MLNYLLRRALYAVMAIWAVSIISFFIINLPPGDYVTSYIAQLQNTGSIVLADEADNLREFYGINKPLYVQYGKWINQIAHGNLGYSFEFGLPVNDVIGERLILTMILALVTVVFIWIVAIPIGIFSAVQQYSIWDHTFTFFGFIGLAVPDFLLALIMMYMSFVLFDFSIGGLFSPDYVAVGWSLGRVWDLPNSDNARQPAGRTQKAIRSHRTGEGDARVEADSQVSSTIGSEPCSEPYSLHPSVLGLRQHCGVCGSRPANGRSDTSESACCSGYVPCWRNYPDHRVDDRGGNFLLGPVAGID